ncbi:MAG: type II toxin-antitoxin system VapC family toxin [Proteobacteria bacterium]|nr:type II toxin-antitoxin system VapC family toxin [Pseudomonadota bacterium]
MKKPIKVLDAWAILAWIGDELPAAEEVNLLLRKAEQGSVKILISIINLGEAYYRLAKTDRDVAERMRHEFSSGPFKIISLTDEQVWQAAGLKADYAISSADAFAASLAMEMGAELVTGDPDFKELEREGSLKIEWLKRK